MPKMSRSERKLAIREEAKRKVHGPSATVGTNRAYRESVEKGRKNLLVRSQEGGDSKAKRAKSELTYLLNNYLPKYDSRIEQLIDDWRRSGDPSYDPGIRVRLREARREHMKKSSPL